MLFIFGYVILCMALGAWVGINIYKEFSTCRECRRLEKMIDDYISKLENEEES